ncbi:MAG: glycosyl hydrolase-related protein, partial [Cyanobacteria bacterium J06633_2]
GYAFSQPLIAMPLKDTVETSEVTLPPIGQFLNLPQENLFLMSLKQAEDNPNAWSVRFYEGHGEATTLALDHLFPVMNASGLGLTPHCITTVLEEPMASIDNEMVQAIAPWKIVTVAFQ